MYKSNKRSRLLSNDLMVKKRTRGRERNKRKMKYDFVCKSDPVSHINNRKTTTRDKKQQRRDSSFTAFMLFSLPLENTKENY